MSHTHKRLTIAFLTRSFSSDLISYTIWSGVAAAARDSGVNLICLPGNPPRSRFGFEFQANALYDLVNPERMNGLIVWGGAMVGGSSPEDTRAFYRRFEKIPLVNISLELDGIPCLTSDNYSGMLDACAHLIENHGCRRLAFIRGSEGHPESRVRFQAYTDALARSGLAVDPALIVTGNFLRPSGSEGIKKLLDERKLSFDAVACANDLMALGAADELLRRGVSIPDEVKLAGFDDIEESRFYRVPLTTVRQPFREMGETAVADLLSLIRGEPFAARHILDAQLIARQSCGCLPAGAALDSVGPSPSLSPRDAPSRTAFIGRAKERMVEESGITEKSAERLAGAYYDEVWEHCGGTLSAAVNGELLDREGPAALNGFHIALSALRRFGLECLPPDPLRLVEAETLMQRARLLVGEYLEKTYAYDLFRKFEKRDALGSLNRILISTHNIDDVIAIIAREFPKFGIRGYYLCLYEHPAVSLDRARLILACRDGVALSLPADGMRFPITAIVPDEIMPSDRRRTIVIEPLYFKGEQLGYMAFEDDGKPADLYEELRSHLSVALKGTLLFREKETLLAEREAQTRSLLETSAGLARSNAELEKFSSIVSHDLKEPLRKIAVFAERLQALAPVAGDAQAREYSDRMIDAACRMRALIDDLLAYSRLSMTTGPFQKVDLNESIRSVLRDLEVLIEREKAEIDVGGLPVIEAEPRHIEQLLQNLIANALKFHPPGRPVRISISSRPLVENGREYCELTVRDNGIGIDARYYETIFGLFQRLHVRTKFEGTGIGLAICRKVADEHHGRIRVESKKNAGASFIVTLPVRQCRRGAGCGETFD